MQVYMGRQAAAMSAQPDLMQSRGGILGQGIEIAATAAKLPAIPAAAPTTASTALSAITSAATASLHLGTRLIHVQCAPSHLIAIERGDCFFAFFRVGHFHETKTARAAGIAIGHDTHSVHLPVGLEKLAQLIFRGVEIEITDKDVLQANCLCVSYLSVSDFGTKRKLVTRAEKPELADSQMPEKYSRS